MSGTGTRSVQVSVVIPTHGRTSMLARAIASAASQTLPDIEILVVDDNPNGSREQEASRRIASEAGEAARLRWMSTDAVKGAGAARNVGIRAARAPYVAFLDDDDAWHADKLRRQRDRIEELGPGTVLVYTGYRVIRFGRPAVTVPPVTREDVVAALLERNYIGPLSTVMCRTDALRAIGGFDEGLPARLDADLYLRLPEHGGFACLDDALVDYHVHDEESIVRNPSKVVVAHEAYYLKHLDALRQRPRVHRIRLLKDARVFLWGRRKDLARDRLRTARSVGGVDLAWLVLWVAVKLGWRGPLSLRGGWLHTIRRLRRSSAG